MAFTLPGIEMDSSCVQSWNAPAPMLPTFVGIVIDCKLVQFLKVYWSIVCKLEDKLIDDRFAQIIVFANVFISATYVLNDRKVTAKILERLEKMKI